MADRKISDLTALTTPAAGDFLPIVDISEAAAASKNKRITIEELMRGMPDGTAAAPSIAFETDPNTGIFSPAADTFGIATGGSERARIDSSGRLLVGTSTARDNFFNTSGLGGPLQVEGANSNAQRLISNVYGAIGAAGPILCLGKHRSNSVGGNTVVQSGDECGIITFQGSDGAEFVEAASIRADVDGTPGSNDMPGRLVFFTTADGASSPTEAMRINNQREVLIGTTTRNANGGVLQLSSGITFPATAVAATDANTLDDYEEGTWTPVYTASGGSIGATAYTQQAGTYTKIGRQVTAKMRVVLSSKGSWTGTVIFNGLPFTAANNSQQNMGSIWTEGVTFADQINSRVGPNEAYIVPRILTSAAAGDYLQASAVTNLSVFYVTVTYFV